MPRVARSDVDYTISLARPGQQVPADDGHTCSIQDIELTDGRTVTVEFVHIADDDGCLDFTEGWKRTNNDGSTGGGQKDWDGMKANSKRRRLGACAQHDRDRFVELLEAAIANGDAVPSAQDHQEGSTGFNSGPTSNDSAAGNLVNTRTRSSGSGSTLLMVHRKRTHQQRQQDQEQLSANEMEMSQGRENSSDVSRASKRRATASSNVLSSTAMRAPTADANATIIAVGSVVVVVGYSDPSRPSLAYRFEEILDVIDGIGVVLVGCREVVGFGDMKEEDTAAFAAAQAAA